MKLVIETSLHYDARSEKHQILLFMFFCVESDDGHMIGRTCSCLYPWRTYVMLGGL